MQKEIDFVVNYADKMVDDANKKALDLENKLDGVSENGKK